MRARRRRISCGGMSTVRRDSSVLSGGAAGAICRVLLAQVEVAGASIGRESRNQPV